MTGHGYKRVLIHASTIERLRAIRDAITKRRGIYWVLHPGELLALVAEALRIIADIVDQAGVGNSDGLAP